MSPAQEAVEAVSEGIAAAHNRAMEANDPYWQHHIATAPDDWMTEAHYALAFIRDAIHRDGDDADAIREALGLTWDYEGFDRETGEPRWSRVVGEWQEAP